MEVQKLLARGERVSAIAAMSMIAVKMVTGGVDGDAFYDFACALIPHLMVTINTAWSFLTTALSIT